MEKYLIIPIILSFVTVLFLIYPWLRKDKTKNTRSLLFQYLSVTRWLLYSILIVFVISFYFLIALKVHLYLSQEKFEFDDLVDEFDTTGLSIGLLGIIIGLITVYYVEKQNMSKEADAIKRGTEFQAAINALKKATNDNEEESSKRNKEFQQTLTALSNATESVKSSITSLNEIKTVLELIDKVSKLFENANKRGNHIYMMTHLTSFGQFLIRNAEIICSNVAGKGSKLSEDDLPAIRFHEKYMEPLLIKKRDLDDKIRSFVHNHKLHVGVLSNKKLSPDKINKMRPFIEERILNGKLSIVINPNSNSKIDFGNFARENVFIHPSDYDNQEILTNSQQKEMLVNDIIQHDTNLINNLNATNRENVEFKTLDYVPFQFFVSAPQDEHSDYGWHGIIIYSNYYNLGYDGSVVSFTTENATMCRGLKDMWRKLVIAQKEKDKKLNPIKKMFLNSNEIIICLKNIEIPDKKVSDVIGYQCVTPVPDILGKDHLIALLRSYEVRYCSAADYIKNTDTGNLKTLIKNERTTLFSLGIFYNPLTIYIGDKTPLTGNSFFKLFQKTDSLAKNKIHIARGGTRSQPQYFEFTESFRDDNPESLDYAIFSRLKIYGHWIYVGGGLNYYGSEKLHTCIEEGSNSISDKIESKEFILVFSLKKREEGAIVKCILFSVIGEDEKIVSEYNDTDIPDLAIYT